MHRVEAPIVLATLPAVGPIEWSSEFSTAVETQLGVVRAAVSAGRRARALGASRYLGLLAEQVGAAAMKSRCGDLAEALTDGDRVEVNFLLGELDWERSWVTVALRSREAREMRLAS